MIIGWIGVGLLVLAYIFLIFKQTSKLFITTNIISTILLLVHAMSIKDYPFIVVNTFIIIALGIKQAKGGI
jgi:hypothetical protein